MISYFNKHSLLKSHQRPISSHLSTVEVFTVVNSINFIKARYLDEATVNYKTALLDSKLLPSEVSMLGLR